MFSDTNIQKNILKKAMFATYDWNNTMAPSRWRKSLLPIWDYKLAQPQTKGGVNGQHICLCGHILGAVFTVIVIVITI